MQIQTRHVLGALGATLDPGGPYISGAMLNKTEIAALARAADILEALRALWGGNDDHPWDTDVATAMYTLRDLAEGQGLELGEDWK